MIHSGRLYSSALTVNLGLVAKGFEIGDLKRDAHSGDFRSRAAASQPRGAG